MADRNIFITGATGLLGSHIMRLLFLKGHTNIVALRRRNARMELVREVEGQVTWVEGDITDRESMYQLMEGVTDVIHAAALITYDRRSWSRLNEINVRGTSNVVDAALHQGVKRMIYVGSISAFVRTGKEQWIDEETEWAATRYTSEYGRTKHLAELEVWRGEAEGLATSVILPSIIMGSGFWNKGSLTLFKKVASGVPIYPGGSIGFVDVRDVALLAHLLLNCDESVTGRFLASGSNHSYREIFTLLAERFGKKPPRLVLNETLGEIAWRLMAPIGFLMGKTPVISRQTVRTTTCQLHFDNRKSLAIQGMRYTELGDSLDDIVAMYQKTAVKNGTPTPLSFRPEHLL